LRLTAGSEPKQISRNRDFDESGYFTWIYEGDKSFSNMMTTLLVVGFLFCTCFPIWPNFLKVFVWYMSVTLLIFIFFLITVRGAVFLCIWVVGYECWVLPNLFDETLGFVESFKPFISFEPTKEGQLIYRLGIAAAFGSFCWWAVTQPSEFDGMRKAQNDFIKDLYAGTLLSDMSQSDKDNIDKPKMPSLDDLLKKLDSSDDEEEELDEEEKVAKMLEDLVGDEDEDIDVNGEE
jgi:translocation protein SEC62